MQILRNPSPTLGRALLVMAALTANVAAFANPTGPTVVNGSVTFLPAGNVLQITNTPNAIINWQSFSVSAGELTRFTQQSAASAVLNRVTTQNPSAILGALESNGRVFLVNPNGILFGANSRIDAAGLVASTLNLSDADFLAGRLRFAGEGGAILQAGSIATPPGGQVMLIGGQVINTGQITAPHGDVILAAGESVELVDPATPNLSVQITAADHQVVNLGRIIADAGRIGIFAGLIDHSGTIGADTAVATDDGRIVLKATHDIRLAPQSTITATGPGTGDIQIQSVAGNVALNGASILADPQRGNVGIVGATQESGASFIPGDLSTFGAVDMSLLGTGATSASGANLGVAGTPQETATVSGSALTFNTTVPTLITGVPTLTSSASSPTSTVPTLITGVPTLTSSVPATTASFFTVPLSETVSSTSSGAMTAPFGTVRTEGIVSGR